MWVGGIAAAEAAAHIQKAIGEYEQSGQAGHMNQASSFSVAMTWAVDPWALSRQPQAPSSQATAAASSVLAPTHLAKWRAGA